MNYQARLGKLKEVPLGPKLAAYEPRAKSGLLLVFYKSLIGTQDYKSSPAMTFGELLSW